MGGAGTRRIELIVSVSILAIAGASGTDPAGRGDPHINLGDPHALPARYVGHAAATIVLERSARPLALASADFDEDGVPDLAAGYALADGTGLIALHRGNVDAIHPHTPEARKRRAEGRSVAAPFLPDVDLLGIPEAADLLASGDFDADGHPDLAAARRGGSALLWCRGDGQGRLAAPVRIPIDDAVSALVSGDVNRRDGLAELLVGVEAPGAGRLLVFESPDGALRGDPERVALPGFVTGIAHGQLDEDPGVDIAIVAGGSLLLVRGRDRSLMLDPALGVPHTPPRVDEVPLGARVTAAVTGDFDADGPLEIAALMEDGRIALVSGRAGDQARAYAALRPEELAEGGRMRLVASRTSSLPGDDLILFATGRALFSILHHGPPAGAATGWTLDAGDSPASILPLRLNTDALDDLVILPGGSPSPSIAETLPLATFTVTSTSDSGAGSLRQAILDAEAAPGADLIVFDIPGPPPHIIRPVSGLPLISGPVTLDATTEPDFAGSPVVLIDGALTPAVTHGLRLHGGASTVRGLAVTGFSSAAGADVASGIDLGGAAGGTIIEGNLIGVGPDGSTAIPNHSGLQVSTPDNLIGGTTAAGRNVISGNGGHGVWCRGGLRNKILGNLIGADVWGTSPVANDNGAMMSGGCEQTEIGGTVAGAGNLVSGNKFLGVSIQSPDHLVQANRIGTDATGRLPVPNGSHGVVVGAAAVLVGGPNKAARNVISGNLGNGVLIEPGASSGQLMANYVGVDSGGTGGLGNGLHGIEILGSDNRIGGADRAAANVISSNQIDGIELRSASCSRNLVEVNLIGTDDAGSAPLPNLGDGISIHSGASANMIGVGLPGQGNVISGNEGYGVSVLVSSGADNLLQGNLIGTTVMGDAALTNVLGGVLLESSDTSIGGPVPEAGNVISSHAFDHTAGVLVRGDRNLIQHNLIGTDLTGTMQIFNYEGIRVTGDDNLIRRNLISGNLGSGVMLAMDGPGVFAERNRLEANTIGTTISGTVSLNNFDGVAITDARDNLIGGGAGLGNVISGNFANGVILDRGAVGNAVVGNLIGTDPTGAGAVPNNNGVMLHYAVANLVERNVLSGNSRHGVHVFGTATQNIIRENFVGTDISGATALGNLGAGVFIQNGFENTFQRNVLSANAARGLDIFDGDGNVAEGNIIGLDVSGGLPLGNLQEGVLLRAGAARNRVGGPSPGQANRIAFNGFEGIANEGGENQLIANAIARNGRLGIDLDPIGVTPNDPDDSDTGANDLQNFPVLTSVTTTGGAVAIAGLLDSVADTTFRLDFYASAACDPSGHGEAERFIGSMAVVTDAAGDAPVDVALVAAVAAGEVITATATDPAGNTSELSACMPASGAVPPAPLSLDLPSSVSAIWTAVAGAESYALYRGGPLDLPLLVTGGPGSNSCLRWSGTTPGTGSILDETPAGGGLFWYLAAAIGPYGESSAGQSSDGSEHQIRSSGTCAPASCTHDKCMVGVALDPACGSCVGKICLADPWCCQQGWDAVCVEESRTICGSLTCQESRGQCTHTACSPGPALVEGCDEPPLSPGCVAAVCAAIPQCCDVAWDSICVDEVAGACQMSCE